MAAIRFSGEHGIPAKSLTSVQQFPFTHGIQIEKISAVKNGLLSAVQAAYCVAYRSMINPHGKPYTVVYGASGPDIATPLLSCDPKMIVCVDVLRLHEGSLERAFSEWGNNSDPSEAYEIKEAVKHKHDKYFWFGESVDIYLEHLLILELKKLGVSKSSIKIVRAEEGYTDIHFKWAYPGEKTKERTVRYHHADLTCPSSYPPSLQALIKKGFEVYYQKSSMNCIAEHGQYLSNMISGATKCLLISPTPSPKPGSEIDENVWQFLGQKNSRLNNVNEKYEPLFKAISESNVKDGNKYCWYMELWTRLGGR